MPIDRYLGLINNVVILGFCMVIVSLIQRGFFWKFFRVRISFGRLIMVRLKEVNQWNYANGEIIEGNLIFSTKDGVKRINVTDKKFIYRSLGCQWIDLDNSTNALIEPASVEATQTHDAIKTDSLIRRCLLKPTEDENKEKIKMFIRVITLVLCIVIGFMVFNMMKRQDLLNNGIQTAITGIDSIKNGFMVPTT